MTRQRAIAWSMVGGQFALLIVLFFLPTQQWSIPAGLRAVGLAITVVGAIIMVISAVQLGRGLTASPLPSDAAVLRTGGLFRWVRHPIYTGLLTFAAGHVISDGSWLRLVVFLLLVLLLTVKAHWEEARLVERFPGYRAYAAATPRFIPGIRPRHASHSA